MSPSCYLPEEQSDAETTRTAVEECGRRCELIPGDLTDPEFCDAAVERTVKAFGRIDILVSNAAQQSRKELSELDDADLQRTFETNIFAYMRLARAALRHMKRAGIIATSSRPGSRARTSCRITRQPRARSMRSRSRWRST